MLVSDVDLERVATERQQARTADERDVVEHHDIERPVADDPRNGPAMHDRTSELVRKQGRKYAEAASQSHDLDAILNGRLIFDSLPCQPLIGVDVVDDRDLVTAPHERTRGPLDVDAVPAEIERRIKRRQKAKAQAPHGE